MFFRKSPETEAPCLFLISLDTDFFYYFILSFPPCMYNPLAGASLSLTPWIE